MEIISKKLFTIAEKARLATEKFANQRSYIGSPTTLMCYCAIGSKILQLMAKKADYKVTFIQGVYATYRKDVEYTEDNINHCWIEYKNAVIDITATQFGFQQDVFVRTLTEATTHIPVLRHDTFAASWGEQNPKNHMELINKLVEKYFC